MAEPDRYFALRNSLPKGDVSFGAGGVHFFEASEIEARQIGYSVGPNGNSLRGGKKVIGCQTGL